MCLVPDIPEPKDPVLPRGAGITDERPATLDLGSEGLDKIRTNKGRSNLRIRRTGIQVPGGNNAAAGTGVQTGT